jgi:hypothetical protein
VKCLDKTEKLYNLTTACKYIKPHWIYQLRSYRSEWVRTEFYESAGKHLSNWTEQYEILGTYRTLTSIQKKSHFTLCLRLPFSLLLFPAICTCALPFSFCTHNNKVHRGELWYREAIMVNNLMHWLMVMVYLKKDYSIPILTGWLRFICCLVWEDSNDINHGNVQLTKLRHICRTAQFHVNLPVTVCSNENVFHTICKSLLLTTELVFWKQAHFTSARCHVLKEISILRLVCILW